MKRLVATALALLVIGAAPPVADGTFVSWLSAQKQSVRFTADGVSVAIDPLPCGPADMTGDRSCRWEGYNNQAQVTITAPGLAPFVTRTDRQSSYARVAIVRLGPRDVRPSVVIDSDSGGSAGDSWVDVVVPTPAGFRTVALVRSVGSGVSRNLQGEIADHPRDVSGDGIVDFVMENAAFASTFGCGACTPRPPLILSVIGGRSVDLSADRSVRAVFAADLVALRPRCFASGDTDRNGACAAYVADAARAGRFDTAWREMLMHYQRKPQWGLWQDCRAPRDVRGTCPDAALIHYPSFPASLRAFLVKAGYITPAQAKSTPLG